MGQANTLQAFGDLSVREDDMAVGQQLYDQALTLYQGIGDSVGLMNTNMSMHECSMGTGIKTLAILMKQRYRSLTLSLPMPIIQ